MTLAATWQQASLRSRLMAGILLPVVVVIAINTLLLYRQALQAADTAYDRSLLATAKVIGEHLQTVGQGADLHVQANLTYSVLEAFEADNRSRIYYRVSGFRGEMVSGFEDLPPWTGTLPRRSIYAALVDFYDDRYRGTPVRMAVLLQPVAGVDGRGMATIQVAETLELRQTLARQLLFDTLWRQAALVALIAAVVVWVVQRATRPVRRISATLDQRAEDDLTPLDLSDAPRELRPLMEATNQHMARLQHLLENQKRFVRDTSHQLRTPLAVLKAQVQSARRGDVAPELALTEIAQTVDRATELANQMLALAKVEQLRQQDDAPVIDWAPIARQVALDLSPLIADRQIDFSIALAEACVRAHEWSLRELTRNLLHNAIKYTPEGGAMAVTLTCDAHTATFGIADSGPGISDTLRERLFQPFASESGQVHASGAGLGLAICREIVHSLGGQISLDNRTSNGRVTGLDTTVRLPLNPPV